MNSLFLPFLIFILVNPSIHPWLQKSEFTFFSDIHLKITARRIVPGLRVVIFGCRGWFSPLRIGSGPPGFRRFRRALVPYFYVRYQLSVLIRTSSIIISIITSAMPSRTRHNGSAQSSGGRTQPASADDETTTAARTISPIPFVTQPSPPAPEGEVSPRSTLPPRPRRVAPRPGRAGPGSAAARRYSGWCARRRGGWRGRWTSRAAS